MMTRVYYDGQCGLCRREIDYYKTIAPDGLFAWIDVTRDASSLDALGVSYVQALKLLHVVDDQGRVHIGVDAFIQIWGQLAYWRILAKMTGLPLIYPLAKVAYRLFAHWRFARLDHCQIALRENP
jgi:predicted DCC family thiol-disulfide oxidoreductase YuxK